MYFGMFPSRLDKGKHLTVNTELIHTVKCRSDNKLSMLTGDNFPPLGTPYFTFINAKKILITNYSPETVQRREIRMTVPTHN